MATNWDDIANRLREIEQIQNRVNNSASDYMALINKIGEIEANIKKLTENRAESFEKQAEAINDMRDAQAEINAAVAAGNVTAANEARQRKRAVNQRLIEERQLNRYNQQRLDALIEEKKALVDIAKEANKLNIIYREAGKIWNKLPSLAQSFYGKIKNLAAVQMSKDIKAAELSMGILNGQSKFFSKTISTASESTIQLGVGVSDLAKGQADYSAEIGRSVMLSEAGYEAMAEMAKGTTLGMQGAAQMAGDMERFGLSVESSRDAIQKTVDIAHSMGVNAEKAIKGLGKNLKIANTYHFKGGVNGMAEMAVYAEKMKVDMGSIASMAGKVFRPEGAVEMAARLQTMGGSFARLGNPFELMFKARNDFGAFTKDVANATAELAQFNENTGQFEISGLQLDRLREIATITGIGEEQLSEMAKAGAKFNQIKSLIPSTFETEDKELISSLAKMGKDGQWRVRMDGKDMLLNELDANALKRYKDEKESLDARAQQAQTFDDAFNNLVNQFKTVMLPFVESLNSYFVPALRDFQKKLIDENWIGKMKEIAEDVGNFIVGVGKVTTAIIDTLGIGGTLATILGGTVFFNAAKWYAQGVQLGLGFNTVARAGTPGTGPLNTVTNSAARTGSGFLSNVKGAATSRAAIGGGALAGIMSGGFEYMEQRDKGKSVGESLGRGALKGAGAGLGAWGGAALGASIGAMGGPLAPVTVPLGALIGGGIGAFGVGKLADLDTYGVDDAIIKFNPQDKIVSMDDGLVASTSKGKIDELVQGRGTKKQKIEFGKLDIGGKITLEMPGATTMDIDLTREPEFVRKLSTMIQEQLRTNLAGGKLSPNPIPRYDN